MRNVFTVFGSIFLITVTCFANPGRAVTHPVPTSELLFRLTVSRLEQNTTEIREQMLYAIACGNEDLAKELDACFSIRATGDAVSSVCNKLFALGKTAPETTISESLAVALGLGSGLYSEQVNGKPSVRKEKLDKSRWLEITTNTLLWLPPEVRANLWTPYRDIVSSLWIFGYRLPAPLRSDIPKRDAWKYMRQVYAPNSLESNVRLLDDLYPILLAEAEARDPKISKELPFGSAARNFALLGPYFNYYEYLYGEPELDATWASPHFLDASWWLYPRKVERLVEILRGLYLSSAERKTPQTDKSLRLIREDLRRIAQLPSQERRGIAIFPALFAPPEITFLLFWSSCPSVKAFIFEVSSNLPDEWSRKMLEQVEMVEWLYNCLGSSIEAKSGKDSSLIPADVEYVSLIREQMGTGVSIMNYFSDHLKMGR